MTIAIGADHAGFQLKERIKNFLQEKGLEVLDKGTGSDDSVDYPDFGHAVAEAVTGGKASLGIIMCGSGNGINMAANKHEGIRSALSWNEEIARLAREHNDANILALPARYIDQDTAIKIVEVFLNTPFEGGRHARRRDKI